MIAIHRITHTCLRRRRERRIRLAAKVLPLPHDPREQARVGGRGHGRKVAKVTGRAKFGQHHARAEALCVLDMHVEIVIPRAGKLRRLVIVPRKDLDGWIAIPNKTSVDLVSVLRTNSQLCALLVHSLIAAAARILRCMHAVCAHRMIGVRRAARRLREPGAKVRPRDAREKDEARRVGLTDGALHDFVRRLQLLVVGHALEQWEKNWNKGQKS